MDKLNLLKLLVAVVDRGNFANAAANLGLSPSTVSKAVSRLEADLNLLLFHRSTRQLTLTPAGSVYVETARKVLFELEQCEQQLNQDNDTPKGLLKINTPVSYGRLYVTPLIEKFCSLYPDISVELSYNDAYVDMISAGIDVSIRSGTLDDSNLIARQLSPIDFLICGSPQYLEKMGRPRDIEQLGQHQWVRFRYRQTGKLHPVMDPVTGQFLNLDAVKQWVVDDGEAFLELCAQSLGLAQLPHFIARRGIERKEIEPVLSYYRPPEYGVWLLYPRREFLPTKIRVFVEFMQQQVAELGETPQSTWAERYQ